jgi:hypothetical protein
MTKKISETLTAARAIIADPAKWTQGTHARDASGNPVRIDSKSATCFCADGALALAAGVALEGDGAWAGEIDHYDDAAKLLRSAAEQFTGQFTFVAVNDGDLKLSGKTPHEAILAVFDRSIDLAKSREELGMTRVAP